MIYRLADCVSCAYLADIMNIILPAPLEASLTEGRAALHLAIGLYTAGEVTLGQAAEVAHLNQTQFMHELGHRQIPLRFGLEDLAEDIVAIRELRELHAARSR